MLESEQKEIRIKGIGVSPGICIGKAYLVDREGVEVVTKYPIEDKNLENEKNRFKNAVKKAKEELARIIEGIPDEYRQHANILQTHIVLMKDKMLYGKTIEKIEKERINSEWALKEVVANVKSIFKGMTDPYFRQRADDVTHVAERIMNHLMGAAPVNIKNILKRVILVAEDLSPAETSQIQLEWIQGFITNRGGITSHTAIIARTLQIPAIVGLNGVTELIQNGTLMIVDGSSGILILYPEDQTLIEYEDRKERYEAYRSTLLRESKTPAATTDGVLIRIMGNIELPEEVVSVKDNGGEGVGLYRTEFQYVNRTTLPLEAELFEKYREVVEIMSPAPVTIRTLDINADKTAPYLSEAKEINPALGLRAIRYCLKKPDVFKTQLRAILRAAVFGNVRILIPMISGIEEVIETKRILNETAEELEKEGQAVNRNMAFGIMIEVPSAAVIADLMAPHADFFSIGTNDLIQYSLAIDRGNNQVAHLYHPLHPAIIRLIKYTCDAAKARGIPVFMCGEMAGMLLYIPLLIGLGIDELSMNPQSIPAVKRMIRRINAEEARNCVKEILQMTTSSQVMDFMESTYKIY